jgi:CDP-diacylglycerol--serine O-phosphatidyltransferase
LKLTAQVPNLLTLCNLLSGVLGIIWVLEGQVVYGAYFVLISAGFDFFDGFAARLLKVQSSLGKELDSLADVVSFGVLPGILLYALTKAHTEYLWLPYFTLVVPLLSAYRLAKFNLDTRQTDRFIGLPTPANALFLSTLPYLVLQWPSLATWIYSPAVLIGIAWVFSLMLVAELPLIALKFKDFTFAGNKFRYFLLLFSTASFAVFQLAGIPLIILAYLVLSFLENLTAKE